MTDLTAEVLAELMVHGQATVDLPGGVTMHIAWEHTDPIRCPIRDSRGPHPARVVSPAVTIHHLDGNHTVVEWTLDCGHTATTYDISRAQPGWV